jgi:predicted PurR-regulated permease PerM
MTAQPVGNDRPRGRLARLFEEAGRRHVPLRTILVTAGVVVAAYVAGKLIYWLRDIVLLMLVAGFVAMLLNPAVAKVQRRVPRRGLAVTIVTLWGALVFIGLVAAFGVPLVNGITHLANRLPGYVVSAQHGGAGSATSWPGTTSRVGCNGTRPSWSATPSRSASRR